MKKLAKIIKTLSLIFVLLFIFNVNALDINNKQDLLDNLASTGKVNLTLTSDLTLSSEDHILLKGEEKIVNFNGYTLELVNPIEVEGETYILFAGNHGKLYNYSNSIFSITDGCKIYIEDFDDIATENYPVFYVNSTTTNAKMISIKNSTVSSTRANVFSIGAPNRNPILNFEGNGTYYTGSGNVVNVEPTTRLITTYNIKNINDSINMYSNNDSVFFFNNGLTIPDIITTYPNISTNGNHFIIGFDNGEDFTRIPNEVDQNYEVRYSNVSYITTKENNKHYPIISDNDAKANERVTFYFEDSTDAFAIKNVKIRNSNGTDISNDVNLQLYGRTYSFNMINEKVYIDYDEVSSNIYKVTFDNTVVHMYSYYEAGSNVKIYPTIDDGYGILDIIIYDGLYNEIQETVNLDYDNLDFEMPNMNVNIDLIISEYYSITKSTYSTNFVDLKTTALEGETVHFSISNAGLNSAMLLSGFEVKDGNDVLLDSNEVEFIITKDENRNNPSIWNVEFLMPGYDIKLYPTYSSSIEVYYDNSYDDDTSVNVKSILINGVNKTKSSTAVLVAGGSKVYYNIEFNSGFELDHLGFYDMSSLREVTNIQVNYEDGYFVIPTQYEQIAVMVYDKVQTKVPHFVNCGDYVFKGKVQYSEGEEVFISVTNRLGYGLDHLTILDSNNNEIEYTFLSFDEMLEHADPESNDYYYKFTMPDCEVSVDATYVKLTYLTIDNKAPSKIELNVESDYQYPDDEVQIDVNLLEDNIKPVVVIKDSDNNIIDYEIYNQNDEVIDEYELGAYYLFTIPNKDLTFEINYESTIEKTPTYQVDYFVTYNNGVMSSDREFMFEWKENYGELEAGDIVEFNVAPLGFDMIIDAILLSDGNDILDLDLTKNNGYYSFEMPESNVIIKVSFITNAEYSITYKNDVNTDEVVETYFDGETVDLRVPDLIEGYEFVNYTNQDNYELSWNTVVVDQDLIITAHYTKLPETYTVTYTNNVNDDVNIIKTVYNAGETHTLLNPSTIEGYNFVKYIDADTSEEITGESIIINKNLTIKAIYEEVEVEGFTVTYTNNVNDDVNIIKTIYSAGEIHTLLNPNTIEGYNFVKYIDADTNEEITGESIIVTKNLTIKAIYEEDVVDGFTVRYINNVNDDVNIIKTVYNAGETHTLLNPITIEGYNFVKYIDADTNEEITGESIIVTKNLTIKAIYEEEVLEGFTVRYINNVNDDVNIIKTVYNAGETHTLLTPQNIDGFKFVKYIDADTNEEITGESVIVNKNLTIKAIYEVNEIEDPIPEMVTVTFKILDETSAIKIGDKTYHKDDTLEVEVGSKLILVYDIPTGKIFNHTYILDSNNNRLNNYLVDNELTVPNCDITIEFGISNAKYSVEVNYSGVNEAKVTKELEYNTDFDLNEYIKTVDGYTFDNIKDEEGNIVNSSNYSFKVNNNYKFTIYYKENVTEKVTLKIYNNIDNRVLIEREYDINSVVDFSTFTNELKNKYPNYLFKGVSLTKDSFKSIVSLKITSNSNYYAFYEPIVEELEATEVTLTQSNNKVTLNWEERNCTKYIVYRSETGKKGTWKSIAKITDKTTTSYVDKSLTYGKVYYYIVTVDNGTEKINSESVVSKKIAPNKVVNGKMDKQLSTSVTISFDKVSTTGYQVYRSTKNEKGTWTKVATITNNTTTTFKNKKLKSNTKYYYKVRAYKTVNGKNYYGEFSDAIVTKTGPEKTTMSLTKINSKVRDDIGLEYKVGYEYSKGATKYELHFSTKEDSGFTKYIDLDTLSGDSEISKSTTNELDPNDFGLNKKFELGKTYYFRIKTYVEDPELGLLESTYSDAKKLIVRPSNARDFKVSTTKGKVKFEIERSCNTVAGYEIYYKNSKGYKLLKDIKVDEIESAIEMKATSGKTNTYSIRSYMLDKDGNKVYSSYFANQQLKIK